MARYNADESSYLTVDYERGNFSVSPCSWVEGAQENIVAITSKDSAVGNSDTPTGTTGTAGNPESSKSGLSTGAIAGISVAAAVVLALAIGGFFFLKRQREKQAAIQRVTSVDPQDGKAVMADSKSIQSHELSNFVEAHELNHDTQIYQLDSNQVQDAANVVNPEPRPIAYELIGSEVSRVELDASERSKPTRP